MRGRDRLRRTGRDADLHLHVEMVGRGPDEVSVERNRVVRIAHDRNGDKADLADAASRWVEIDPAGARQIDLRPGMGRAASSAARRLLRILERDGEISGSKPRGETERTRRLDHQHGQIAAAAMAESEHHSVLAAAQVRLLVSVAPIVASLNLRARLTSI